MLHPARRSVGDGVPGVLAGHRPRLAADGPRMTRVARRAAPPGGAGAARPAVAHLVVPARSSRPRRSRPSCRPSCPSRKRSRRSCTRWSAGSSSPAVHELHVPPPHTLFVPHDVPSADVPGLRADRGAAGCTTSRRSCTGWSAGRWCRRCRRRRSRCCTPCSFRTTFRWRRSRSPRRPRCRSRTRSRRSCTRWSAGRWRRPCRRRRSRCCRPCSFRTRSRWSGSAPCPSR